MESTWPARVAVQDLAKRASSRIDEGMVVSAIFDHDARLRSYAILAEAVSRAS